MGNLQIVRRGTAVAMLVDQPHIETRCRRSIPLQRQLLHGLVSLRHFSLERGGAVRSGQLLFRGGQAVVAHFDELRVQAFLHDAHFQRLRDRQRDQRGQRNARHGPEERQPPAAFPLPHAESRHEDAVEIEDRDSPEHPHDHRCGVRVTDPLHRVPAGQGGEDPGHHHGGPDAFISQALVIGTLLQNGGTRAGTPDQAAADDVHAGDSIAGFRRDCAAYSSRGASCASSSTATATRLEEWDVSCEWSPIKQPA
jgi:hypothetical protein